MSATASAQREPWLQVEAANDPCIDAEALRQEVKRLLPGGPGEGIWASASAAHEGWTVTLRHATGQRAVRELPSLPLECDARLRAVGLATVLAVEHALAAASTPATEQEQEPEAVAPADPVGTAQPTLGASLFFQGGVAMGDLPKVSPALAFGGRLNRGSWVPLELRLLGILGPAKVSLGSGALETRQVTTAMGACRSMRALRGRISGCLGVELGAVRGRGLSLPASQSGWAGSGAVDLGATGEWPLGGRLALSVRLEGVVRYWRPAFRVGDDVREVSVRRLPPAGGRAWLGLSWGQP